uniref:Protein translocase subunit SecY n=2 Tax=environmental samples TaxID=58229 RepID=A0A0H4T8Q1_9CHLR|nr:preprotein translocase subunit, preprotein translocase subunit SecY [uncultured Chloroflexi bacterium Rifle_16ft_4_minimus_450]
MKRSPLRFLWVSADIRNRLLITLALLAIYRLAAHVPVPGVDRAAIQSVLGGAGAGQTIFNLLDLLSGGTVSNFSVLAMGVYPYITAQIILQLLVPIVPALQRRMEEDPREGRKWMEKWTYFLALPMAALNAIGQIQLFRQFTPVGSDVLTYTLGFNLPTVTTIATMTAGTMFAIWLGELISEHGIRNQGLSLIIFAGIVSRMPANILQLFADETQRIGTSIFLLFIMVATIFAIVFVQEGRRNVPVMYPGRRVGNRMSMPVKGTLPLMVNMAGMIPLIFAQSILTLPAVVAQFFVNSTNGTVAAIALWLQTNFGGASSAYWILYFLMVVGFTFFYTDTIFAQQNYGENLRRAGAQIPGVTKGAPTQRYLTRVLRRITLPGAVFLGVVAVMPFLIRLITPIGGSNAGLLLVSSAGLLIVVGVVRDVYRSIEAELKLRGYDSALLVR